MAKTSSPPPHIVIVPSPGMGHLIPLGEFAKRVVLSHGLTATFVVPTNAPLSIGQKVFLEALPKEISNVVLPPVDFDDLASDVKIEQKIALTMVRSLDHIRATVQSLKATTSLVAMVVDLFGTDVFEVANEYNISPYIFYPSTAMALSLFLYLPKLDQSTASEYKDLSGPVQIPGCIPIQGSDLLDPVQDRKNDAYKWLLHHTKRYTLAEGIMVNSFKELESRAIRTMQENGSGYPPVYPVGPLVDMGKIGDRVDKSGCLEWLDDQPHGSVLFISFGSAGVHSLEQITEIAMGLELSEQKFLWVLKCPSNNNISSDAFFNTNNQNDPLAYLPKGFLERTKGVGFVLPTWAPQAQILSHGSTGGFLTHCGWNSTLESLVNGVPLIAWPLYAEQKMNAVLLTEDVKVALRPKFSKNGLVEQVEIATVVKNLMEGEEGKRIRSRMRDLKTAADKTLSADGESTTTLTVLTQKWVKKASVLLN